jgi:hypothetical protein
VPKLKDLLGSSDSSNLDLSTDYFPSNGNLSAETFKNVRPPKAPHVQIATAATLGRAKSMWAFENPIEAQGSLAKTDDAPMEMPKPDPGSNFALNKVAD